MITISTCPMIIYTCPQCGGDLREIMLPSNPPIHQQVCPQCGWQHEERESVIRIPFSEQINANLISIKEKELNDKE